MEVNRAVLSNLRANLYLLDLEDQMGKYLKSMIESERNEVSRKHAMLRDKKQERSLIVRKGDHDDKTANRHFQLIKEISGLENEVLTHTTKIETMQDVSAKLAKSFVRPDFEVDETVGMAKDLLGHRDEKVRKKAEDAIQIIHQLREEPTNQFYVDGHYAVKRLKKLHADYFPQEHAKAEYPYEKRDFHAKKKGLH